MKGSTYRRCYCRGEDGRPLGKACPKLSSKRHGVWCVRQELPPRNNGTRRAFNRAGYASAKEAQADLEKVRDLLALPEGDDVEAQIRLGDLLEEVSKDKRAPLPELNDVRRQINLGLVLSSKLTVGEWLDLWLESKKKIKTKTTRGYESIIRVHLKPLIGHIRLDRLSVPHLDDMFQRIDERNERIAAANERRHAQAARCRWSLPEVPPASKAPAAVAERARLREERAVLAAMPPFMKLTGPATKQRIRACLRTALNAAIARQRETGLTFNAAEHVELSGGQRPKGLLWTEERIARWQETGEVPSPVMAWTPQQLGQFLDEAVSSRYYIGYRLVGYHCLRRGEAAGARRTDLDVLTRLLWIAIERTLDGWTPVESDPKTEGSAAPVLLDEETVRLIVEDTARKRAEGEARLTAQRERRARGEEPDDSPPAWVDSGYILTEEDGTPVHPEKLSDEFQRIRKRAGLPPINIRDARHTGAGLVKAAGGDIHDAKVKLRHSTIKLTSDTYMVLFQELKEALAEGVVAVVPRARKAEDEPATEGA
ncbi:tyrosine-type recombinase/integrase [Streptomyces sp. 3MP-14]|uniref:Tyrosine-type recombinase/integrase n=1 Tax=Streptomyces mimosae TaxID=2586635 RepID=A0A5N6ADY4_9ACTN|nr:MULTISPECIES: tyrosine-type recombinase/integrase [Streptomyces]KAB8167037.1 tyrosine-type recombinase/integrase [Streptomyces mimosae]KAB8176978.1 tyrosine-type recombinase/integrase [Streptomyces sp. 3MP-14]